MAMALLEINDVSFVYPDAERPALLGVSAVVEEGEFIVLGGPSGSGKSTLLRHMKKQLLPAGRRQGTITYDGVALDEQPDARMAQEVGIVLQNPESQIVMDTVWHELVFAMENIGIHPEDMHRRVADIVPFFGMETWLYQPVRQLSGGQKQWLNLASVMLLHPRVLLLDEPFAQLDPVTVRAFVQLLQHIHQELGITIIVSEHRLEELLPCATRLMIMDCGSVIYDGPVRDSICKMKAKEDKSFLPYLPSATQLYLACPYQVDDISTESIPLTVQEGKKWFAALPAPALPEKNKVPIRSEEAGEPLIWCENISFRYGKDAPDVLHRLSITVYQGECLVIMGGNGAGKSTFLQCIAGLVIPQRGTIKWQGQQRTSLSMKERQGLIGYVPQNLFSYFIYDTVEQELCHAAVDGSLVEEMMVRFGLREVKGMHPYDCSGGQQQKIALACALLARPKLLLLDEPTKGIDPKAKQDVIQIIRTAREEGMTVILVTHDTEFAAQSATRCAMLFDGGVAAIAPSRVFFTGQLFYTTAVNRIVRQHVPDAVTIKDIYAYWSIK
ncbi:ABC transporter, ATP-binding protein [Aneurinibacillus aneurinilyticus ATCC 12856]|uniref:ABC transporter, ATP-binding protein n=2 Tax=Aneurinibacillus aneurinilyticus TaxID=1391 RepID=U1WPW8_ANEAE|nr:ABC transporter, ATP-binding protein [Aneurinibacillus aneurinilyticus ATCC 12856]